MKSLAVRKKASIVLLILAALQFACLSTAGSPNANPPQASGGQAAQTLPAAPATKSRLGTPDEAKAMLKLAIEHYQSVGRTQALADFNSGKAPFLDRDLYVACIDSNLTISANGGFPNLVGSTTQPLSRAAWDAASTGTIGTVNYQWIDPVTKQTLPKTLFYEKVGSDVCGVGAYNP